ncbi:MAG TPA: DUF11 domain-containing protein [Edaphobacter sp.]
MRRARCIAGARRFPVGDQRGVARPQGPHSDIGAFEFALFSADLSLTSQTSATQIVAGDSFTYTVQLRNSGPDDAEDVVFSDLPPAGVTFTSCSSTQGNCTISGGGASLNLATLADGDAVTITIQATLSTTVIDGATLANTPSVTSSTSDPNTTNNSGSAGSASITVQNKSDLFVTTQSNLTAMGGTVTCNFANMASGATVTITVQISKLPNKGSITNTAVVSSPNFDPNPANKLGNCKNIGLRQQMPVENHYLRGYPPLSKGGRGRCAWLVLS